MGICGSLMDIYDYLQARSAYPERGYLWKFKNKILWTFLTKTKREAQIKYLFLTTTKRK